MESPRTENGRRSRGFRQEQDPPAPKDDAEKQQARQNWYFVAEIEQYAGRPDETLAAYESVINAFGADDDTLGRKAGLLKSVGRRDDARSTYNRFQNQPEGQNQIANSFREEQKWDQAIAIYQNLLTSDAKNGQRWNWSWPVPIATPIAGRKRWACFASAITSPKT